jgi:hypothetical protein
VKLHYCLRLAKFRFGQNAVLRTAAKR